MQLSPRSVLQSLYVVSVLSVLSIACGTPGSSAEADSDHDHDHDHDAGDRDGAPVGNADSGAVEALDASVPSEPDAGTPVDSQACILENCIEETISCALDGPCMDQLNCIGDCADVIDDQDAYNRCTLRCNLLYVPASPEFEAMMACALENGCSQDVPHECSTIRHPERLHDLTAAQLEGEWYNVQGYNRGTDCFDCSYSTFTQGEFSAESRLTTWRIDWLMDDLGMRFIEGELTVGGPDHPGVAVFRYGFAGVQFVEYYNMVYHRGDAGSEVVVFVGCGGSDTPTSPAGYSIGMVLTRQRVSELPAELILEINDALVALGLEPPLERMSVADWCWNEYDECPAR